MKTLALFLAFCLPAFAGTRDESVPDSRYLAYGSQMRPYTAQISGRNADGQRQTATAVIVAPRWAITAAHVVVGCDDLAVSYSQGVQRGIDRVSLHPEWALDNLRAADVAMCHLEAEAGLEWYPQLADEVGAGSLCIIAGYGVTGLMATGYDVADGKLRAGTQRIDRVDGVVVWCKASRNSPMAMCISPGDSGGPLFIGSGRDARLAAIHSFQSASRGPLRSRYGEETGHISIPAVRGWIDQVMEGRDGVAIASEGQTR